MTTLAVLTAVPDPDVEAGAVAALTAPMTGIAVARRCVELAELLSAAAAGTGRVAVVTADLRGLDRDAVLRLAVAGVGVVGLVRPGDAATERRLRQLGIDHLSVIGAAGAELCATVRAAVAGVSAAAHALSTPYPSGPAPAPREPADAAGDAVGSGRVVAVWGPTGAPGRSTLAVNLASELALLGARTLLVDADGYGGTIAQLLGILDDSAGVAAACRLANAGALDRTALAGTALEVRSRLSVLTGIARADRWPELRPGALDLVLEVARQVADVVVVDCGFCLEQDEELSFDTAAPRRNGATLSALAAADAVLAVTTADPVGLQRFVRGLGALADALPGVTPTTVVNRVRNGAIGPGDAKREIKTALERFAGVKDPLFVPLDMPAFDTALAKAQTLSEASPKSPARQAIRELATTLMDNPSPRESRFSVRRRRRSRVGAERA